MAKKSSNVSFGKLGVTLGDYEKCVKFCQGLGNSEQILKCIEGCASISSAAIAAAIAASPAATKKVKKAKLSTPK